MSVKRIITDDESLTWGHAMIIIAVFLLVIIGAGVLLVVLTPLFEGIFTAT